MRPAFHQSRPGKPARVSESHQEQAQLGESGPELMAALRPKDCTGHLKEAWQGD